MIKVHIRHTCLVLLVVASRRWSGLGVPLPLISFTLFYRRPQERVDTKDNTSSSWGLPVFPVRRASMDGEIAVYQILEQLALIMVV